MNLTFSEQEKSLLLLQLTVENNILLKNVLINLSSLQADIDDVRNELISEKYDLEKMNKIKLDTIKQYNSINGGFLENMKPKVESYLDEVIQVIRSSSH